MSSHTPPEEWTSAENIELRCRAHDVYKALLTYFIITYCYKFL